MSFIERELHFDKTGAFRHKLETQDMFSLVHGARNNLFHTTDVNRSITATAADVVDPLTDRFSQTAEIRQAFIDGGAFAVDLARKSSAGLKTADINRDILPLFPLDHDLSLYGMLPPHAELLRFLEERHATALVAIPESRTYLETLSRRYATVRQGLDQHEAVRFMSFGFTASLSRITDVATFLIDRSHFHSDGFDPAYRRLVEQHSQS